MPERKQTRSRDGQVAVEPDLLMELKQQALDEGRSSKAVNADALRAYLAKRAKKAKVA